MGLSTDRVRARDEGAFRLPPGDEEGELATVVVLPWPVRQKQLFRVKSRDDHAAAAVVSTKIIEV